MDHPISYSMTGSQCDFDTSSVGEAHIEWIGVWEQEPVSNRYPEPFSSHLELRSLPALRLDYALGNQVSSYTQYCLSTPANH